MCTVAKRFFVIRPNFTTPENGRNRFAEIDIAE